MFSRQQNCTNQLAVALFVVQKIQKDRSCEQEGIEGRVDRESRKS